MSGQDLAGLALGLVFGFIIATFAKVLVRRVTRAIALRSAVKFMSINGTAGSVLDLAAGMESYIAHGRVTR